ncbi:MAG: nitroreductase family protein [Candidatus Aenigmarchaeota archaeon]|nr:nitroreductase family protein [Candidatus Aenigmarchaeota archaeon]
MDFFNAVTTQTTVKRYEKKDVDDKLIGVILHMANHADSAGNLQGWEFIVIRDPEIKKQLHKAALKLDVVKDAPVDIVVCADLKKFSLKYEERGEYLYSIQDTTGAITIMMLTAQILGLGANWIRALNENDVKTILGLPNELRPVGIITLGYAFEKAEKKNLKSFEHMTSFNKFKQKYDISYLFQIGPKEEVFKPIVNQIIDKLKKKE